MTTITECRNTFCQRMFRDGPETAGICPTCGTDNGNPDDETTDYLKGIRG